MQIEDIQSEGLSREYQVTLTAGDIDARIEKVLLEFRETAQIKGFRKGKAPISLLKRMHGERAYAQVINEAVNETSNQVIEEKEIRPALRPEIEPVGEPGMGKDLVYSMKVEVLPDVDLTGFAAPAVERWVAEVGDADMDQALERLAEGRKSFRKAAKTAKAKSGDAVLIDYLGRVDGEAFEGGAGEDYELELGSNTFIPGFEDQLVGSKAGDEKDVTVTFPTEYHADNLAGKEAVFAVTVKEVRRPEAAKIDEEFAKGMGFDDLDALKEALKGQIEGDNGNLSRLLTKRRLLDVLADQYSFEVPPRMVELEFSQIEAQLKQDAANEGEEAGELSDSDKEEFRAIAERRVRLGLLLSELGTSNNVEVTQEEINRKIIEEARRFPGQEQQVFEYYTKNEEAQAQLRAPIFEEKVVDFIIEQSDVTEKPVTREELEQAVRDADEEEAKPAKKASKKPAAKKTAAKKPAAKKAAPKKAAAEKAETAGEDEG